VLARSLYLLVFACFFHQLSPRKGARLVVFFLGQRYLELRLGSMRRLHMFRIVKTATGTAAAGLLVSAAILTAPGAWAQTAPAASAPASAAPSAVPSSSTAAAPATSLPPVRITATDATVRPGLPKPGQAKIKEPVNASGCRPAMAAGRPYFVEFRSRTAASYGHTFVFHGRLGGGNSFASLKVAGLHPKGDDPSTYMQGHWMPVAAETGASYGDLDEQYLTARFCVTLTEAEYRRALVYIQNLQATKKTWHAGTYNCNAFASDIAKFVGLDSPNPNMYMPEQFIKRMADLNSSRRLSPSAASADSASAAPAPAPSSRAAAPGSSASSTFSNSFSTNFFTEQAKKQTMRQ
jgi:hypothetical protein